MDSNNVTQHHHINNSSNNISINNINSNNISINNNSVIINSTKKREREDEYDCNIIINDQKNNNNDSIINDLINNNKITYEKFKDINYESINYKELVIIANLLEIESNGTKEKLYKRIENYLVIQERIELNQQYKNVNSFNKDQPKLIFTEGIQKLEVSFWRVFRNKWIFKNIFSNFKFSLLASYDDLFGAEKIFNGYTNAFEIFRDKLKSNRLFIRNDKDIFILLIQYQSNKSSGIINNKVLVEFYNQLFKLYSTDHISSLDFANFRKWIPVFYNSRNILAFNLYIKFFKISLQDIRQSMSNVSISISQDPYDFNIFYQRLKILNYFINNKYIIINDNNNSDNNNDNDNNSNNYSSNSNSGNINLRIMYLVQNCFPYSITLKKLFKLLNIIVNLSTIIVNNDQKINKLVSDIKCIDPLIEFTKEQLKLTISDVLKLCYNSNSGNNSNSNSNSNSNISNSNISNSNNLKKIIYKIIKIIVLITKKNSKDQSKYLKPIEYYIIFKDKKDIVKEFEKRGEYISKWFNELFQASTCRSEQFELINTFRMKFYDLFLDRYLKTILETNDIELISFLYTKFSLGSIFHKNNYTQISEIFPSIKTTLVLDFYFNNFEEILFKDLNNYWQYISSISIIEHYEQLMKSLGRRFKLSHNKFIPFQNKIFIDLLIRAISNPQMYQVDKTFNISSFDLQFENATQESLIQLFFSSNYPFKNFDISEYFYFMVDRSPFKYLKLVKLVLDYLPKNIILLGLKNKFDNNNNNSSSNNNNNNSFLNTYLVFRIIINNINNSSRVELFQSLKDVSRPKKRNKESNNSGISDQVTESEGESSFLLEIDVQDLLISLCYCNRIEEIFEYYKLYHNIFFNTTNIDQISKNLVQSHVFYFPIVGLQSFIVYCIDNLNICDNNSSISNNNNNNNTNINNTIYNMLYHSLKIAARIGHFSIFKFLIHHYGFVLKKKVNSISNYQTLNQNLFESKLLYTIIETSINFLNQELAHLLLSFINLPTPDIEALNNLNKKKNCYIAQ